MNLRVILNTVLIISLFSGVSSCKKYLAAKPDSSIRTVSSVTDLQNILDNRSYNTTYPGFNELMSDDFYVDSADLSLTADKVHYDLYLWLRNNNAEADWKSAYSNILDMNIVLDELPKQEVKTGEELLALNIEGTALFIRGFYFYGLAQIYCLPYNAVTAAYDMGIPIRLNPSISEPSVRASVEETYRQIIEDLKRAASLLPDKALTKTRPGKGAAFGALARTYLAMGKYDLALEYANRYLNMHDSLADYNTPGFMISPIVERFKKETIFLMKSNGVNFFQQNRAKTDTILYRSFGEFDLRKTAHYRSLNSSFYFKGEFDGTNTTFNTSHPGINTDEIYLIRSEVLARLDDVAGAMRDLNKLAASRCMTGHFVPFNPSNKSEALKVILEERRRELVRRGLRWTDIRRLNVESTGSVSAKRKIASNKILVLPSAPPYLVLIPQSVVKLGGITQN